jgi:hypothetical protein
MMGYVNHAKDARRQTRTTCRSCGTGPHGVLREDRCTKCFGAMLREVSAERYRAYLLEVLEPALAKCCEKDRSAILRALLMATERAA